VEVPAGRGRMNGGDGEGTWLMGFIYTLASTLSGAERGPGWGKMVGVT
jgi:hypothetical protein